MKRKVPAFLLAVLITASIIHMAVFAQSTLLFTDVKTNDWFYSDVKLAYEMGLINGRSATVFAPDDNLKYSEAVKLAACMRSTYMGETQLVMGGTNWYDAYVEYCFNNGIITENYEWNANATRGDYMEIFSKALPDNALRSINQVDDGVIPDVPMSHKNAEAIYKLYRAGIVQGVDAAYHCNPSQNVKRSEVAAILTRMMFEGERIGFSIYSGKTDLTGNGILTEGSNDNGSGSLTGNGSGSGSGSGSGAITTVYPWEKKGAKKPSEYTLDEYEELTAKEKRGFRKWFETQEAFERWLENASGDEENPSVTNPWEEPGAKQPKDYTWMEYQKLNDAQKGAFCATFKNSEAFRSWLDEKYNEMVNESPEDTPSDSRYPWDEDGAKQPDAYTWAEYQALTTAEQEAFYDWFDSADAFSAWQSSAQESGNSQNPWDKPGAKKPDQYTWTQYEALSAQQKEAFYDWFDSVEGFEAWKSGAQGGGDDEELPWENGGRKPDQYTWAQYDRLTAAQKEAFYDWFGSAAAFDTWMNDAQNSGSNHPWENGGKDPDQYTWEEYEALTPQQKEAFYDWFGSADAFDAWQNGSNSKNPWENGGKKPNRYTWAEYEELTPEQKEAFYDWFASADDFDAWMNDAQDSGSEYPWENGGKLPSEYTFAEFEALGELQEAFVDWFGSIDDFETWLNSVQ